MSIGVNIHGWSGVKPSQFLDHSEGKIIGGEPIKIENLPSAVQFFNLGSLCSGSIINSWSILTAAHCFDNNKDIYSMVIQFGARYIYDYDGEVRRVSDFVIHSNYSKAMPFACDIAIIFVNEVITFSSTVKKALLVTNESWKKENNKLDAAGWGWTKSLQVVVPLKIALFRVGGVSLGRRRAFAFACLYIFTTIHIPVTSELKEVSEMDLLWWRFAFHEGGAGYVSLGCYPARDAVMYYVTYVYVPESFMLGTPESAYFLVGFFLELF
ncbi:Hypodermin-A [Papilio machaon]|uniref:Hypodermin-A n=1 Tax=Papilio machaon TaxID=76193 RepID=A0A194R8S7_PAPMA|nr:Hypodermin-A [Papilio machaon]